MTAKAAIDFDKIKETFFLESEEHLSTMEEHILQLEKNRDPEALNTIFRAAHSMKGNSGCLGYTEINSFSHTLETVLDRLRNKELSPTEDLVSLLLESVDCLKVLVDAAKGGTDCASVAAGTFENLRRLLDKGTKEKSAPAEVAGEKRVDGQARSLYRIRFSPAMDAFRRGIDPINHMIVALKDIGEVLKTTVDASRLPRLEDIDPENCYLSWEIMLLTAEAPAAIDEVFEFISDDGAVDIALLTGPHGSGGAKAAGREKRTFGANQKMLGEILVENNAITPVQLKDALKKQSVPDEASTIRVDTGKVDKLMNLVGELVITQTMISELSRKNPQDGLHAVRGAAATLERNARDMQEAVMAIRMLPVGTVFRRFTRLARDLSRASGKEVSLEFSGEETELDKTLIERIADPLTHLIRNSIDHGIETPPEREAAGKPVAAVVRLGAYQEGGYVVVSVEDDGRGLDRERIMKKAVERGLLNPDQADGKDEAKLFELIFAPGFSTADKVTDLSGRGVGMDVVKRNIEGLGGTVAIESRSGRGMKVMLRIPLTLAIIDGLTVRVGDETFIIPISAVVESLRPLKEDVKTIKGECETVRIRSGYLPLVRLHRMFDIAPRMTNPWDALVVVVGSGEARYAMLVDELTGEQQVVIKSMGDRFRNIPAIAGATIMGDGSVALILDVDSAVKKHLC